MDENTMIDQLEELIKSFGIQIRCEAIKQDEDAVNVVGGLCLLRGEYVLIIKALRVIEWVISTFSLPLFSKEG
jgi:hypothetical protein